MPCQPTQASLTSWVPCPSPTRRPFSEQSPAHWVPICGESPMGKPGSAYGGSGSSVRCCSITRTWKLTRTPGFSPVYQWDGVLLRESPYLRFKPSVNPEQVHFPTGYAEAATGSYATFLRLRDEGIIGPDVLFQVSLPTPMATGFMYVSDAARDAYLPAYERSPDGGAGGDSRGSAARAPLHPVGRVPGSAAFRGLFFLPSVRLQGPGIRRAGTLGRQRYRNRWTWDTTSAMAHPPTSTW